jgi:hypothetical protein
MFFDHLCDWVCYDLYYPAHDWGLRGHLGPSYAPFSSFLTCKSQTSKIHKNHCKNLGFGNMSLLEGPQIGSNMTLFYTKNHAKTM